MEAALKSDPASGNLSIAAQEVRAEVATSLRGSAEHFKYATPRVKLAWGYHGQVARIRHVKAAENGRG